MADIAPNAPVESQGGIVLPGYFQPVTGGEVFLAPAGAGNPSIWRTDGTPEGTEPTVAGSSIGWGKLIGSNGQIAFFLGSLEEGRRGVWATDGTSAGTVPLKVDLVGAYFPGYQAPDAVVVDGRLFFQQCAAHPYPECDLWTSDGTVAGTSNLLGLGRLASALSGSVGRFYFLATTTDDYQLRLWRTDGTAEGTIPLRVFSDDGSWLDVASIGGEALVAAEGKLWITDGDSVGQVASMGSEMFIEFYDATVEGDALYFLAQPLNGGNALSVWRSDGTSAGTLPVLQTTVLYSPSTPFPWVQQLDSRVYYLMPGPQGRAPYTLWSSGAGGEGAQPVSCNGCASIPEPGWIRAAGGRLYFPAESADVHTLWAIDSSRTALPVKSYCTGYCRTEPPVAIEDRLMFLVEPTLGGEELWASDGSSSGTRSLGSFVSAYNLYASSNLDLALFAASTEWNQERSLWMSRGTPASTLQLTFLEGQGSEPRDLLRAGDRVAFLACRPGGLYGAGAHEAELVKDGGGVDCSSTDGFHPFVSAGDSAFFTTSQYATYTKLWATDGTAASTRMVWDHGSDDGSAVYDMVAWGPGLAFWGARLVSGQRITSLWLSDGTFAGTSKAFDFLDGAPPIGSTVVGDSIYFRSQSPDLQIWRTGGTAASTVRLTEAASGEFGTNPEFTRVGAFAYFVGEHGIWRTDGTASGTSLLIPGPVDPDPNGGSNRLSFLQELGGALLFMRTEDGLSTLWRTEGTPGSTQQIAALRVIEYGSSPAASLGGRLFFAADDGVHGVELWSTNGFSAGTAQVRDLVPGAVSSNPRELVAAYGKLYFTADEISAGSELWVSDGSTAGTHRVQDIAPFAASSSPADLTVVGDLLYFSADDGVTGRELWALPLTAEPAVCAQSEERLCLNDSRFQIEVSWRDFAGNTGRGHAQELSNDSGTFWFFDSSIVELIVKVLDGAGTNGHFWVFYGSLSNVEFEVTIIDLETNEFRIYHNPSGTFASVGDIYAFTASGLTIGDGVRAPVIRHEVLPPSELPGSCVPSGTRLCLQGNRFSVEAEWVDFAGNSGTGVAVPMTADSGYFWFFSSSVVEVVAKVVDGRPVNGNFWVFYGALSNVEYTLTVTDTVTGSAHVYHNPSGRFASVGDITPF